MALQSSGTIRITEIRSELGSNSYSLTCLSGLAGKAAPHAMSEFYGYSAIPAPNYKFGSPQLLFDFSVTSAYSNSGTSIRDLSGNGNNGTFSTGTGNGTAATVTGYSSSGYLSLPGNSNQYSVRLPDSLKPSGNNAFSMVVHMKPKGYSYNGNYPGIISHGDNTLGLSWYLNGDANVQGAWRDLNSGDNGYSSLAYSGGAGLNVWSTWFLTSSGYNQTVYQYYNGTRYAGPTTATNRAITVQSGWGFFLGLRYNQWINADISYVAIYNSQLSATDVSNIGAALSSRAPS